MDFVRPVTIFPLIGHTYKIQKCVILIINVLSDHELQNSILNRRHLININTLLVRQFCGERGFPGLPGRLISCDCQVKMSASTARQNRDLGFRKDEGMQ